MGIDRGFVKRRAVFLDRDGVINEPVIRQGTPYPPSNVRELILAPAAKESLVALKQRGFALLVVTNQPDVARGKTLPSVVHQMHAALSAELPLDDFFVCFHDDADACSCRKPLPGLIHQAAVKYNIEVRTSYLVGDRWRDIDAGFAAGCQTVLIDRRYDERDPNHAPDATVSSLAEAARWILQREDVLLSDVSALKVKIFADGANLADMTDLYRNPLIQGFTTNPTLMCKAGICDYTTFARQVLSAIPDRPISFEVFSDDFSEMERHALTIAAWGNNVFVKIPVTNTLGQSSVPLITRLSKEGVKLNVTALMTLCQVKQVSEAMADCPAGYVSVFAGRIADTGRDPVPMMRQAVALLAKHPQLELIWASPRELLNVFQASDIGCHVITATSDILKKLSLVGKNLNEYSLETVKMFRDDALKAGFAL